LDAYTKRRFDGNIVELLNLPRKKAFLPANIKYILRDEYVNVLKLMEFADITDYPVSERLTLDNTKIPANFLSFFKTKDCAVSDCDECGYCALIAKKALKVDGEPLSELISKYEALLGSLVSGEIYETGAEPPQKRVWGKEAEEVHGKLLESVPGMFRSAADRMVRAEFANRSGAVVDVQDVFEAWLKKTPAPFRKSIEDSIESLKR
jgi:hypothetical protein